MKKNIRKRLTALGLILPIMVGSFGWCMTKVPKKRNGYSIETADEEKNGLYTYIIDTSQLESKNNTIEELALNYSNINYAKVVESVEYGTYFYNEKDKEFYGKNLRLALPSCYDDSYDPNILLSNDFDQAVIYEKVKCLQDLEFTIIYSAATAKRDVEATKETGKMLFNKGDKLYSTAIYYQNELVGYKQYGVGSECEDIAFLSIGNVDAALKTVSLNEMTPMSYEGLKDIEEELNGASARSRNLK